MFVVEANDHLPNPLARDCAVKAEASDRTEQCAACLLADVRVLDGGDQRVGVTIEDRDDYTGNDLDDVPAEEPVDLVFGPMQKPDQWAIDFALPGGSKNVQTVKDQAFIGKGQHNALGRALEHREHSRRQRRGVADRFVKDLRLRPLYRRERRAHLRRRHHGITFRSSCLD